MYTSNFSNIYNSFVVIMSISIIMDVIGKEYSIFYEFN